MPQNTYTNADLARFDRTPGNYTVYGPETPARRPASLQALQPDEPSVEDLLAQARATLGRGDAFLQDVNTPSAEPTSAVSNEPSVLDSLSEKLSKLGGRLKTRHDYAMSQPAEQRLAGAAKTLGMFVSPEVMAGLAAKDLYQGGTHGVVEHPIASAINAALVAAPSLRGLKGLATADAAGRAASTTAENARLANEAERELVDSYAARELASGSQKTPPTILRRAHEAAGRVHGETTVRRTQLHSEWPELPTLTRKKPAAVQGLMEALDSRISGLPPASAAEGAAGPVSRGGVVSGAERRAPTRYTVDQMRQEANRFGLSLADYIQSLRQGGGEQFVMPSAELPRVR